MRGRHATARSRSARESALGRILLVVLFVTLLGGRFSVRGLPGFPGAVDIRWILFPTLLTLFFLWLATDKLRVVPEGVGPFFGWFTAWCAWMAVSGFWSPAGADVFGAVAEVLLLWVLVAVSVGVTSRVTLESLSFIWILSFGAAGVYLLAGVASGLNQIGRMSALGGGPNVFVRIMVVGAVSAVALSVQWKRMLPLTAVPLFLIGALLSGSRGGVAAAAVVAIVGLVVLSRTVGVRQVVGGSLLMSSALWLSWQSLDVRSQDRLYSRFVVQTLQNRYTSGRDLLAAHAVDTFQAHPFSGAGLGSFGFTYGNLSSHAHNLFLAVASEAGAVGLVLLLLALMVFLKEIWPKLRAPLVAFGTLAALAIFVASLFSGDYYDTRFMWFFMVIAAVGARRHSDGGQVIVKHGGTVTPAQPSAPEVAEYD